MKKYTWLLFFLYFGIFIASGLIFYYKYLDRFLKSGAQSDTLETAQSQEFIYYSQENNLYRLDPELALDPANRDRVERIQSTGQVSHLDVSPNGSLLVYETKNSAGLSEIWQVKTATNESQRIAYQGELSLPKFNQDGTKLAFIARETTDKIIIENLATKDFNHLSDKFAAKIVDFTWTADSQKIVFCTSALIDNACYLVDIASGSAPKILEGEILQIAQGGSSEVIYLAKEGETANLISYDLKTSSVNRLTDLKAPKKVTQFNTDKKGEKIAYEVSSAGQSDIYFVRLDGSNRTQVTSDGKAINPICQSSGEEIAFVRTLDAIYTINLNKTNEKKIVNLENILVKLLLWR